MDRLRAASIANPYHHPALQSRLELMLESLTATGEVGRALGRSLPERSVCLLFGEMGAGKTTFIKAVCEGMGILPSQVISPTYTLVNIYEAPRTVYHVDFFRLTDGEALLDMDRNDWINPEGSTLIEWPEAALPLLTEDAVLELRLADPGPPPERRTLGVASRHGLYEGVFEALRPFAGG